VHLAIPPLAYSTATGVHKGILREAIQAFKYENSRPLAAILSERLILTLEQLAWHVDLIAPIPLHISRLRERGYNQSALLAEILADETRIPFEPNALLRLRNTPHQVGLSGEERLQNVSGAFKGNTTLLDGKAVLLIDDVTTTGATLQACAFAALEAGAASVSSLTVSSAEPSTPPYA
jgi:ComF family protein